MKQNNFTLWDFRNEAKAFKDFKLVFGQPLSPFSFSIHFCSADVCLAPDYIFFETDDSDFTLSHITCIEKGGQYEEKQVYKLHCDDTTFLKTPIPQKVTLICGK